jgi:protein SCO1/2
MSLALTVATGTGLFYWYRTEKDRKLEQLTNKNVVVGAAAIGGPFDLIDASGKRFTDQDLLGEFAMLYFGFTHCPDVCPEELEKIAEAVQKIGACGGGFWGAGREYMWEYCCWWRANRKGQCILHRQR